MAILLKRYSNRRLYDTGSSQYITLEELARRIRAGEDFRVVDSDTERDLTKRVLVQILLLESLDIAEILPLDFLKTLIRLKDGRIRELFIRYLRMSLDAFSLAQKQIEENMRLAHEQMAVTASIMKSLFPFGGAHTGLSGSQASGGTVEIPAHPPVDVASEAPEGAAKTEEGASAREQGTTAKKVRATPRKKG